MDSRKIVIKQTVAVAVGVIVLAGVMVGIYGLLHRFSITVLWSALAGSLTIILNYFFMAMTVNMAADRATQGEVTQAQKMVQTSSVLRLVAMGGILLLCILLGAEPLALLLPILFGRPVLTVWSFFGKKEGV
jgi:hypothetical protein